MFTGLIEDIGKIYKIETLNQGKRFFIELSMDTFEIKIGDSISINGACQTVTEKNGKILTFEAMFETLKRTNFNCLKKGDFVNIERAMLLNSRLDGHLVSGHVDLTAKLKHIKEEGIAKVFGFESDTSLLVEKGSVSINGVSLTVSGLYESGFEVSLLPHTLKNTNFKYLKINDYVNIEFDMISKYVKKILKKDEKSKITEEFLIENGF